MQRYNIFNQIHKGLRAMLYDTAMSLQHTVFSNMDESADVLEKVELVIHIFHTHAQHEDNFILPILKRHNVHLFNEFESEHATDESLAQSIRNLIAVYYLAASEDARVNAGNAITMAFNEFIAFNLYHMNKEEDKINKTLWQNYSDHELRSITQAIMVTIPANDMNTECKWIIRGTSNLEIIKWLCSVKNDAPDFVFKSLFSMAEAELPEHRWNEVKDGLMEGCMIS